MTGLKKVAAFARYVLLVGMMIASLIAFVMRLDVFSVDTSGFHDGFSTSNVVIICVYGLTLLYVFTSVLSIIVRIIRRKIIDKHSAMTEAFQDTLIVSKNIRVISFFRALSFWGTVMLLINYFVLNVPASMFFGGPFSSNAFLSAYHGFLFWSLLALILTFVVSVIFACLWMPHYGDGAYSAFQIIKKFASADMAILFREIKYYVMDKKEGRKDHSRLFRLIIIVLFIIINVLAVLMQLGQI